MKILLSYSRRHFDPAKTPDELEFWGSSANILARSLYQVLSELGEVTYVDAAEVDIAALQGQAFDLFVGPYTHFLEIKRAIKCKKNVLWAVNMHSAERNKLLQNFVRAEHLSPASFADWDMAPSSNAIVKAADYILCVGNMVTYNSYIRQGVPKAKIKLLNYGVGPAVERPDAGKPNRFVYIASEIGLRKGFDILARAFTRLAEQDAKFHLDIIGLPASPFYQQQVDQLQERLGSQLTNHGWVKSATKAYEQIIEQSTYVVAPSLEEGQSGAVLDAIRLGAIPILSYNTGVDFSPLGHLEIKVDSAANVELLQQALRQTPAAVRRLQAKTLEYYREYHENFAPLLKEALEGCVNDTLYPKMSLIIPIFNKERTILSLLRHIDLALREYQGNGELHLIFDGCKDNTERLVRRYYRHNRGYPVTYETTPNIFEVKTNNLGLKKSTGKYCVIVQDDNFVYDVNFLFEAATFLDKNPTAVILGGLAGVNYYPRGTTGLKGAGQIAMNDNEVYWRQDAETDPSLRHKFFEVDACMRGPLILRKSFLEEHGYLDEIYVPFYQDDMDIAFRARKYGYKVYAVLMNVENKSLTIAGYSSPERQKFWEDTMKRNADIFYKRWTPSTEKDYAAITRTEIENSPAEEVSLRAHRLANRAKDKVAAVNRKSTRLAKRGAHKLKQVLHGNQ